jgi:hypothetical protein
LLAGFWIIDVESPEQAYQIAARASAAPGPGGVTGGMPIEVREILATAHKEWLCWSSFGGFTRAPVAEFNAAGASFRERAQPCHHLRPARLPRHDRVRPAPPKRPQKRDPPAPVEPLIGRLKP